jgi:hypothetical protein
MQISVTPLIFAYDCCAAMILLHVIEVSRELVDLGEDRVLIAGERVPKLAQIVGDLAPGRIVTQVVGEALRVLIEQVAGARHAFHRQRLDRVAGDAGSHVDAVHYVADVTTLRKTMACCCRTT